MGTDNVQGEAMTRTTTERRAALDLLRAGHRSAVVAAQLRLPHSTVRTWARAAGLRPPCVPRARPSSVHTPRVIPATGCGHPTIRRGGVCGPCSVDVTRGLAVVEGR